MSSSEFKPYRWLRAINRSGLPKRCRDVLRCLAAEFDLGQTTLQISQRELAEFVGLADRASLRNTLSECIQSRWLIVDESTSPHSYRPGWPNEEDGGLKTNPVGRKPTQDGGLKTNPVGRKPTQDGGLEINPVGGKPTQDGGLEINPVGGKPTHAMGWKSTHPPIIENKAENISAAAARAPARENSFEDLSVETKEILAMLASQGHSLTPAQAEDLRLAVAAFHPSAWRYIARRVHKDEICRRFRNTTGLLRALKDDAARDGVPQRSLFPAPRKSAPPRPLASVELEVAAAPYSARREDTRPKDTYEHPEPWREALETLRGQMSRAEFQNNLAPMRAAESPEGLTLFAGDDFRAAWVNDRHRDLIEAALSLPLVDISARRLS